MDTIYTTRADVQFSVTEKGISWNMEVQSQK